jgi:hypothetical protein
MAQTAVYMYDPSTFVFTGSKLVDDGYQLQEGETALQPTDGLYQPIKFSNNTWVGTPQADWETQQKADYEAYIKEHPEDAPQPSATETALAALSYQQMQNQQTITENQQTISDLQTANAQLAYQVMTTTNGGTN